MKALKGCCGQEQQHGARDEDARRPPDRPYELVGQILGFHRYSSSLPQRAETLTK